MEQIVSQSLVRDRFNTVLFGGFAVVALLLAAFGIYGVMSFVVAQRTHEIGLRMALGAERAHIVRRVVGEGMIAAVLGTAIGAVGAFYMARMMRGVVSGVSGLDPAAFLVVATTLLAAAFIACVVPAARAASVDPMMALRQE
jgi:putative ABC transport system permease protein